MKKNFLLSLLVIAALFGLVFIKKLITDNIKNKNVESYQAPVEVLK